LSNCRAALRLSSDDDPNSPTVTLGCTRRHGHPGSHSGTVLSDYVTLPFLPAEGVEALHAEGWFDVTWHTYPNGKLAVTLTQEAT
jgi:hypothetical protein